ncbi:MULTISPECIES: metal ABC transporter ATP-binding protein [Acidithiobacillus]|uniref:metal ABC transporter ATP-binding protein n=1 Tax=Acidithiobacillus TaxID=119977 RepID=UPI00187A3040|nr:MULTISPECIES: metal ABC transporter ATP-binding protein [Acidithiobacillus]MBE7567177.1 metal ABC transporter ATP-binding protein [Acidithiobacillus sp. HP-11]MBU2794351.1 metal ABC transporter ATP-binding protein [Acidithiobacillus thiooxidans]MBU2841342.1 metal ABC transporter ATP-binding protein [Acidithiobacillus thiooxidans]
MTNQSPILAVADLSVDLGGRSILRDVSFDLYPGQLCALIGENGAGKTTLLRTLLGLITQRAGTVRIGAAPAREHRELVGYVPQKINFDPDLPLRTRDLVRLGLDGQRLGLPFFNGRTRHAVDQALQAVGAEEFADQRVGELSGGQQQRAVIAHALVRKPRLLILDEPLANLDFGSANALVDLLGRLIVQQQMTVLVTAHDMNPLIPVMDRLVYLVDGRAATGTVSEVVQAEVLSKLYGYPVSVLHHGGRILVLPDAPENADVANMNRCAGHGV